MQYHLAQVNIARMRGDLADPIMAGLVSRIAEMNALAERSRGFVWRLRTDGITPEDLRTLASHFVPFKAARLFYNMTVWEDIDDLRHFVLQTKHADLLRDRHEWMDRFDRVSLALWWIPVGHRPTVGESVQRLCSIQEVGLSPYAFSFARIFQSPEENGLLSARNNAITTWPTARPIEGSRIRLRCISLKDARTIADIMTTDVSRWLASWPANPTVEAVTQRISRAQKAMQEQRELHFRIDECERNLTVGYVSVAKSDTDCKIGHLTYWLGSAFQGKGYMTEAVRLAMAAGFQYLDLETIEAGAHPDNLGSFAVMKRVGMRPIGERMVWVDNRHQNERSLFYSVDRSAFQALLLST